MRILLGLGPFRFQVTRHAYEQLERRQGGRWVAQERIGRAPANQFLGAAEGEITISATIYPEFTGGLDQVRAMQAAAEAGLIHMLVSGAGRVLGRWVMKEVTETGSMFLGDGTPRKAEVEITLGSYGDDNDGGGFWR